MSALDVSSREDRRDEVEHVGRRHLVVAEVLDQPLLDDIDLRLGVAIDDRAHERRQLDRVLLVLEQLGLERLVQPLVGLVVERPALDRQNILNRVWGYDFLGETNIIEVYVRYLREKIEDSPSSPRLIVTVRGVGYILKG